MVEKMNFLDDILRRRDEYREMMKTVPIVKREEDATLENNRMGFYRWFQHPAMKDIASRALLVWIHEIPPGSHSGKEHAQGGRFHLVLEGRGYTMIDDERHDWEENDVVLLPLLPDGTVYQHFNADPERWAKLLCAEPNFYDMFGVDQAAGYEILEDSPDYKPGQ